MPPNINTSTYALIDAVELTDFDLPIDLVRLGPTGGSARQFIVLDAGGGILEIETAHGLRRYNATLLVGIPISLAVFEITPNTNVGSLLVGW